MHDDEDVGDRDDTVCVQVGGRIVCVKMRHDIQNVVDTYLAVAIEVGARPGIGVGVGVLVGVLVTVGVAVTVGVLVSVDVGVAVGPMMVVGDS